MGKPKRQPTPNEDAARKYILGLFSSPPSAPAPEQPPWRSSSKPSREDWNCSCGKSNFATRATCRECGAPKPFLKPPQEGGTGKGKGNSRRRGKSKGQSAGADKPSDPAPPSQESLQEAIAAQKKVMASMNEGPARVLINAQIMDLKTKLASQKPPTLGSQLNSAEARVKKASLRKKKLEETIQEAQKGMQENDEELRMATQQLEEVKSALKGENPSQTGANARAQSAEPAVADVTAGVLKELTQILSTLQLTMEASTLEPINKEPKARSRSTSRGRAGKSKAAPQKEQSLYGMQAAIQRICLLGQQLETLQATAGAVAPSLVAIGGQDPGLKSPEKGPQNGENTGQEDKDTPGAKGSKDMEVEATLPADTVPPSAQPHGT
eukprot:3790291-Amphidinium_carterae.2